MLGKTSVPDSEKASVCIQLFIRKFQPAGQPHAASGLHYLHNT